MVQDGVAGRKPYIRHCSPEEIHAMCLQVAELLAGGKRHEAEIVLKEIPLLPKSAKLMKEMFGSRHVVESGYNLVEALEEFGPDWLKGEDA